ncbi:hypothetical protein NQ314_000978 [Rhamnusium bicolor]|uniref:Uncharacterized protein n=1 Tax=Rhamnusium bicolor TaxID=1586634 RepID=A0AAV8ZWB3_9CUCU|nr:hypothetical protein NQ314_000978 [Rhamnusium bicolor]
MKDQYKECFKKDAQFNIPNTQATITNAVTQRFKKVIKPSYLIHPSVTELSKTYPQVKLPPLCLKSHIAPVVSMEMDEVESYFKRRKLDINVYIKSAFKSSRKFEKLNQTNIITKSNPGIKTLIETENKNSVIKSVKKAKLVNAKRSVQLDTVKQRLKKNIDTSVNKIRLTTRPLLKSSQNISSSKVKRKRNLLKIPTKREAKKLSCNDLLNLTPKTIMHSLNKTDFSMLEDTTKIKVNEESIFKESLNLTPKKHSVFFN